MLATGCWQWPSKTQTGASARRLLSISMFLHKAPHTRPPPGRQQLVSSLAPLHAEPTSSERVVESRTKQDGSGARYDKCAAPAESWGPPFQRSVGGPMGPGLRQEGVLVAVSCTAGRQRRWGTNFHL